MKRTISTEKGPLTYQIIYKRVKNINMRVRGQEVFVSAPRGVPAEHLDELLRSRVGWVEHALAEQAKRAEDMSAACDYTDAQCMARFEAIRERIHPLFAQKLKSKPPIVVRLMKTRWGVCHLKTGTITLNKRLMDKPEAAIEYVILHEYVHFDHPDHQAGFHAEMKALMPDYKQRARLLKG